jgi:hypothetical protein
MRPRQEQNKIFFDQLQNVEGLDLQDTRGLQHELRSDRRSGDIVKSDTCYFK